VTARTYKLDELARAAGTSPRTVRYYVQRGLLPPPVFRGKDTAYEHEHLVRLRAIRKLQEAYLPLDAVAAELDRRTPAEIERLAEGADQVSAPGRVLRHPSRAPESGTARAMKTRTWHRVELAPGIELSVADDATPDARRLFARAVEAIEAAVSARGEGEGEDEHAGEQDDRDGGRDHDHDHDPDHDGRGGRR
jgi:DNA-binding transcriptional MerR regulator